MSANITLARNVLETLEQRYVAQFDKASAEVNAQAAEVAKRGTIASRKKAWENVVHNLDVEALEELRSTLSGYLDKMVTLDTSTPRELTETEARSMMDEYIDLLKVTEFFATRKDAMKTLTFGHLDSTVGPGVSGAIAVPSTGMQFKREGAGQADPTLDVEKLLKLLGKEDAAKVLVETHVPEVVIPAHTEITFSEEALIELIGQDAEKMELLKQALAPGKVKDGSFTVRAIPKS